MTFVMVNDISKGSRAKLNCEDSKNASVVVFTVGTKCKVYSFFAFSFSMGHVLDYVHLLSDELVDSTKGQASLSIYQKKAVEVDV